MRLGGRKRWAFGAGAFLGFVALSSCAASLFAGCADEGNSYCSLRCDCQGCSQIEREDCVDDVDDAKRLADYDGCGDKYAAYIDCYVSEGSCPNEAWVTPSSCVSKGSELKSCSARSAKFVRTACQEERDKRKACDLSGGGSDPCLPDAECVALCSLAATCDELANPQTGSPYVDCVFACSSSGSSTGSGFGP